MFRILIFIFLLFGCACSFDNPKTNRSKANTSNKKDSVEKFILKHDTTVRYILYSESGLVEDFNNDGRPELVALVANAVSNEIGVRIIDGGDSDKLVIFGAGNEVNGIANLRWIKSMRHIPKGFYVAPTLIDSLTGDILGADSANGFLLETNAIHLIPKHGHSSEIIYWDGISYSWIHQE